MNYKREEYIRLSDILRQSNPSKELAPATNALHICLNRTYHGKLAHLNIKVVKVQFKMNSRSQKEAQNGCMTNFLMQETLTNIY